MAFSRPGTVRRLLLAPFLLLLSLLLVAACSSGTPDAFSPADRASSGAGSGAESAGDSDAAPMADEGAAAQAGTIATDTSADDGSTGEGPMMIRSVRLQVLVEDVSSAVARARAAASTSDGWVSSEDVSPASEHRAGSATLVLRVPAQNLDAVVAELGELGTVTSTQSEAEDVTVEYRDVEARVKTLEASAERLRTLVAEAESVEAIASLERELADREVELDALKARMKVLAEDVARSTITLHLAEDGQTLGDQRDSTGFLAGLRQGWDAFLASVTVLLTALGALLPFLLVAGVLLVPLALFLRRRRQRPLASTDDRQATTGADPDGSRGRGSADL